jgi:hypothetical protein
VAAAHRGSRINKRQCGCRGTTTIQRLPWYDSPTNPPAGIKQQEDFLLITNAISDSKRQQTTTVDYKRLFNGFILTGSASLRQKPNKKL